MLRSIFHKTYLSIPEINPRKYFFTRHILGKMTLRGYKVSHYCGVDNVLNQDYFTTRTTLINC